MIDIDCECSGLPVRSFADGDRIIEEGGRSGALFFLRSGAVEVIREDVVIARLDLPGTVLGEISILLDRPHIAGVRAVGPSEFHVADDAEGYLREHPEVGLCIARELARKVDSMSSYLADVKRQYAHHDSHLSMVHEVLGELIHPRS